MTLRFNVLNGILWLTSKRCSELSKAMMCQDTVKWATRAAILRFPSAHKLLWLEEAACHRMRSLVWRDFPILSYTATVETHPGPDTLSISPICLTFELINSANSTLSNIPQNSEADNYLNERELKHTNNYWNWVSESLTVLFPKFIKFSCPLHSFKKLSWRWNRALLDYTDVKYEMYS